MAVGRAADAPTEVFVADRGEHEIGLDQPTVLLQRASERVALGDRVQPRPTVPLCLQDPQHGVSNDVVANLPPRLGELGAALGRPPQRRLRVAPNKPLQIVCKPGLALEDRRAVPGDGRSSESRSVRPRSIRGTTRSGRATGGPDRPSAQSHDRGLTVRGRARLRSPRCARP